MTPPTTPRHLPVLTTPQPAPSPTTRNCSFQVGWEQGSRGPHPLSPQLRTPPKSHSGDFSPSPDPCTHTHLGLPSPAEQPQPWDTHPDPALHSQPPQKAQSLQPSPPARQTLPSNAFPSSAPQAALQAPGQTSARTQWRPHLPTQVLAAKDAGPKWAQQTRASTTLAAHKQEDAASKSHTHLPATARACFIGEPQVPP